MTPFLFSGKGIGFLNNGQCNRGQAGYFDSLGEVFSSLIEQIMIPKLWGQPLSFFFPFSEFLNLIPENRNRYSSTWKRRVNKVPYFSLWNNKKEPQGTRKYYRYSGEEKAPDSDA